MDKTVWYFHIHPTVATLPEDVGFPVNWCQTANISNPPQTLLDSHCLCLIFGCFIAWEVWPVMCEQIDFIGKGCVIFSDSHYCSNITQWCRFPSKLMSTSQRFESSSRSARFPLLMSYFWLFHRKGGAGCDAWTNCPCYFWGVSDKGPVCKSPGLWRGRIVQCRMTQHLEDSLLSMLGGRG